MNCKDFFKKAIKQFIGISTTIESHFTFLKSVLFYLEKTKEMPLPSPPHLYLETIPVDLFVFFRFRITVPNHWLSLQI